MGNPVEEVRSEYKAKKAGFDSNIVKSLRVRKLKWKLQNHRIILVGDPSVEMVKT